MSSKRSVIGIVFNPERSAVVAIMRRDVPIWVLPGGGVEEHESPEQAVVRELFEETGLHTSVSRLVGLYLPANWLAYPTYVFECTAGSAAFSLGDKTGDETRQTGFYSIDQLPTPFFFLHQEWIKDAQKNLPQPIQRSLTEINYWHFFLYFCRNPLQVIRLLLSRLGIPYNNK